MPEIAITRNKKRKALLIRGESSLNVLFPLYQLDKAELDQLFRGILAKQGVTEESEINAIIEKAEQDYEVRIKVAEAKAELRRLMELKRQGHSLMRVGFRKWRQAHYPARTQFKKE